MSKWGTAFDDLNALCSTHRLRTFYGSYFVDKTKYSGSEKVRIGLMNMNVLEMLRVRFR